MIRNLVFAAMIVGLCAGPLLALEPTSGSSLGSVTGGDFGAARTIIGKKCTRCHSDTRIDAALSANRNMQKIQQMMERKGVELNSNERDVLGIYWQLQNPLKRK
jgi:uncharacterized membrane protein